MTDRTKTTTRKIARTHAVAPPKAPMHGPTAPWAAAELDCCDECGSQATVIVSLYWGQVESDGSWFAECSACRPDWLEALDLGEAMGFDARLHELARPRIAEERAQADREWRNERAMQAGMAFGCDGFNDAMGH